VSFKSFACAVAVMLLSLPAIAATADLAVSLDLPDAAPGGIEMRWTATVTNLGPDPAREVTLRTYTLRNTTCTGAEGEGGLGGGPKRSRASLTISCSVMLLAPSYNWTVTASVTSSTADPDSSNNFARREVAVLTPPDLAIGIVRPSSQPAIDPALPFPLTVNYFNRAHTTARGVEITITIPAAVGFDSLPTFCQASGRVITCKVGEVPPSGYDGLRPVEVHSFTFRAYAPDDSSGSPLEARAEIRSDDTDNDPGNNVFVQQWETFRTYYVTSVADEGPASLRSAIESANSGCFDAFCKVAFRIEPPVGQQWVTIRPQRPLPRFRPVRGWIDGTTQTQFFGNSNPLGPEVELSGVHLVEGNGLEVASACRTEVLGLTINGFPGNGILGTEGSGCISRPGQPHTRQLQIIHSSYIGTDPTGRNAVPNTRGIVGEGWFGIFGNLISGNRRAGIFAASGSWQIEGNTIGLNADRTAGLGNGASGIYIGPVPYGSDIKGNHIAFNEHAGVSIDREARYVSIRSNSIHANWQLGIDFGLDGVTVEQPIDNQTVLRLPVITAARFDPVLGVTVIEGTTIGASLLLGDEVELFANDAADRSGFGEGQYVLGTVSWRDTRSGSFSFQYPGDLTGKWVTATATRWHFVGYAVDQGFLTTTSEFSRAVEVSR
jgi:hypothetical protein